MTLNSAVFSRKWLLTISDSGPWKKEKDHSKWYETQTTARSGQQWFSQEIWENWTNQQKVHFTCPFPIVQPMTIKEEGLLMREWIHLCNWQGSIGRKCKRHKCINFTEEKSRSSSKSLWIQNFHGNKSIWHKKRWTDRSTRSRTFAWLRTQS